MKIGVVGFGVVGHAIWRFFSRAHDVYVYDKYKNGYDSEDLKTRINRCDLAFMAVPTPTGSDGLSCDLSAVMDVMAWLQAPVCIKSTIPPGTTERIRKRYFLPLGFSPEYLGESNGHNWTEIDSCGFVTIGGDTSICDLVVSAYAQAARRNLAYHRTDATTAELCKYMENCFLATKVAFVNQFFDLSSTFGVNFEELRRLWLLDSRVSPSHTTVTQERGFGGKCLPKDMRAIIAAANLKSGAPLLEAVLTYNDEIRARVEQSSALTQLKTAGIA